MGYHEDFVDLRQGKATGGDMTITDAIAVVAAVVFGAVHCIAWYPEFHLHFEQQLWRSSTILIIS